VDQFGSVCNADGQFLFTQATSNCASARCRDPGRNTVTPSPSAQREHFPYFCTPHCGFGMIRYKSSSSLRPRHRTGLAAEAIRVARRSVVGRRMPRRSMRPPNPTRIPIAASMPLVDIAGAATDPAAAGTQAMSQYVLRS
jgi:hypothetical protein